MLVREGRAGGRGGGKSPRWQTNTAGRDDVIGTVGGEKRKTSLCVLILFAALKGMESSQGKEFWETI